MKIKVKEIQSGKDLYLIKILPDRIGENFVCVDPSNGKLLVFPAFRIRVIDKEFTSENEKEIRDIKREVAQDILYNMYQETLNSLWFKRFIQKNGRDCGKIPRSRGILQGRIKGWEL